MLSVIISALLIFLTCRAQAQTGIELTGLIAENEGTAAWDADGSGPEPYGDGHETFLYYAATRDYVDVNSDYGVHVTSIAGDFPAFAQALATHGFDPGQVKIRMGLASQGADLQGSDWFVFGLENFMNFYPVEMKLYLDDELMISGLANYMIFQYGPSTGWEFVCTSNYFLPLNASGFNSPPAVQDVAAAFMQDVGEEELKVNLNTFGTTQSFYGNGRNGVYFNIEGTIEKGIPAIPFQGLAVNHEGFAGWDADGTGPEPKADGHLSQPYYLASRDYDGIDPDPDGGFARLLNQGWAGFQNFALQLQYRGYTPEQVKWKMGLRNMGEDIEDEDWSEDGSTHHFNYYHSDIIATLDTELLIGFVCDTVKMCNNLTQCWGTSANTIIYDASSGSSEAVQAIAASFFKDMEDRQVQTNTIQVTGAPGTINTNGRTGGFWQINEAEMTFLHGPGTIIESGAVSGHWTWDGHPYIIEGEIFIENGQTLIIDPGVWAKFKERNNLNVNGTIQAIGDTSNTGCIVFTAVNPDLGWGHLVFDNTDTTNEASVLSHCIFEYGYAPDPDPWNSPTNCGGAIAIRDYDNVIIENCQFRNNRALNDAYWIASAGAIALWTSSPEIRNCIFHNNTANCTGAVLASFGSSPTIANCLFIDNSSLIDHTFGGGALFAYEGSNPVLLNNTFISNHSNYKGGTIEINGASNPLIINNIFWNNAAAEYNEIYISTADCNVDFKYNDIEGGQAGIGPYGIGSGVYENNLDLDPVFADVLALNFQLEEGSPCIDMGIPDVTGLNLPPYDLLGNLRIWDGGNGEMIIDMGPYEFNAPLYTGIDNPVIAKEALYISAYPNPTGGIFNIQFTIYNLQSVELKIYDLHGREVAALLDKELSAGEHVVRWNAESLTAGLYVIRFQAGNEMSTSKLLKVD